MSIEAFNWAYKQPVPNSSAKFVLLVMATRAQPDKKGRVVAFTRVDYLAEITGQDRKTVASNLAKLKGWNLIEATGDRVGRTNQIPVYELKCPPDLFTEQAQKRKSSENGRVPKTARNRPVFPGKQAQKRATDSVLDSNLINKARRGARGNDSPQGQKRGQGPEPSGKLPAAADVLAKSKPRQVSDPAFAQAHIDSLAKELRL